MIKFLTDTISFSHGNRVGAPAITPSGPGRNDSIEDLFTKLVYDPDHEEAFNDLAIEFDLDPFSIGEALRKCGIEADMIRELFDNDYLVAAGVLGYRLNINLDEVEETITMHY